MEPWQSSFFFLFFLSMLSCAQHHVQNTYDARNAAVKKWARGSDDADACGSDDDDDDSLSADEEGGGGGGVCSVARRAPTTPTMDIMGVRQDGEWAALPRGGGAPMRAVAGRGSLKRQQAYDC